MKKLLLIGKLETTLSELNESLSKKFQVQLCGDSVELLQGMLKIVKPDLVVLNLSDMDERENELFMLLEEHDSMVPVIVVVTEEQSEQYKEYFRKKQSEEFPAPITRADLVDRCCNCIIDFNEVHMQKAMYAKAGGGSSNGGRKRILIVDDSPLALRTTRAIVGSRYDVTVATSAKQALQTMKSERPDLILLDYEMPDCDGKMTLEKIRQNVDLCDIPVIFVTAVADKEHIAAVLGMNPAGYFLKPLEKEKVLKAIEDIIG